MHLPIRAVGPVYNGLQRDQFCNFYSGCMCRRVWERFQRALGKVLCTCFVSKILNPIFYSSLMWYFRVLVCHQIATLAKALIFNIRTHSVFVLWSIFSHSVPMSYLLTLFEITNERAGTRAAAVAFTGIQCSSWSSKALLWKRNLRERRFPYSEIAFPPLKWERCTCFLEENKPKPPKSVWRHHHSILTEAINESCGCYWLCYQIFWYQLQCSAAKDVFITIWDRSTNTESENESQDMSLCRNRCRTEKQHV